MYDPCIPSLATACSPKNSVNNLRAIIAPKGAPIRVQIGRLLVEGDGDYREVLSLLDGDVQVYKRYN